MVQSWSRMEARWHSIGSPWSVSDCPSTVRESARRWGQFEKNVWHDRSVHRLDPEKSYGIVLTHKELKLNRILSTNPPRHRVLHFQRRAAVILEFRGACPWAEYLRKLHNRGSINESLIKCRLSDAAYAVFTERFEM